VAARLSGFTALSETAAPEDVMAVLHEFHAAMGELIVQFKGTLERFTADGLKVFFNDPTPCPDPALQGVRLAIAMRERAQELLRGWRQRGHALGFSAAVAMGYATLGVIGYSARWEYGAVGQVSDLATWLCRESPAGQVLITQRVLGGIESQVEAEALGELQPPEFIRGVSVFRLVRLKDRAAPADRGSPLSPREHEVALLVSEGLTNRQIADQLVVTEATAAKHVENILNKLGFKSRAQIASWMARRSQPPAAVNSSSCTRQTRRATSTCRSTCCPCSS
jgi:class 3 adenylate cyclase